MNKGKRFMAVDQYGNTEHGLTRPRKDLMARAGVQHADKMYVDGKDGKAYHTGYIVAGCWYTVCEVTPMRKAVV